MKKARIVLCTTILLLVLLIPFQQGVAAGVMLTNGVVSDPIIEQETEFFAKLTLSADLDSHTGLYSFSGNAAQQKRYQGSMSGTYDAGKGTVKGEYDYGVFVFYDGSGLANEIYTFKGTILGTVDPSGKCAMKLSGTQTWTKYSWERDEDGIPLYELGVEKEETTDSVRKVTFDVSIGGSGSPADAPQSATEIRDSGVRFSGIGGQVEVCIPIGYDKNGKEDYGEEIWEFAELGMVLPYGTMIKQQDNSYVLLSFPDMTTFETEKEGIIVLSNPPEKESQIQLLWGNLKVNVKKMLKDGSMDIEMSQAVLGIKGTTFLLKEDGITSSLKVLDGTVQFTSKTTGKSVKVEMGQMISATKKGLGDIEKFNVAAEMEDWEEHGAERPSGGFPPWAFLAMSGGVLVIALIVIITVTSSRKRRKNVQMPAMPVYPYPPMPSSYLMCTPCQGQFGFLEFQTDRY